MNKIAFFTFIAMLLGTVVYAASSTSSRYELTEPEIAQVYSLLKKNGQRDEVTIVATEKDRYETVFINVETEPIIRNNYKEKIIIWISYEHGQMKTIHESRVIEFTNSEFYIPVEKEIGKVVLDEAYSRYQKLINDEELKFIKIGRIRTIHKHDHSYWLELEIQNSHLYSFDVEFMSDSQNPIAHGKIEINTFKF